MLILVKLRLDKQKHILQSHRIGGCVFLKGMLRNYPMIHRTTGAVSFLPVAFTVKVTVWLSWSIPSKGYWVVLVSLMYSVAMSEVRVLPLASVMMQR